MANDIASVIGNVKIKIEYSLDIASSLIDDEDVVIPEYGSKSQIADLYKGYGEAMKTYSKVCNNLSLMVQYNIQLKKIRSMLNNSGELSSLVSQYKKDIESLLKRTSEVRESLVYVKDKYDALLRFYGSAQYMLGSGRYTEMGY